MAHQTAQHLASCITEKNHEAKQGQHKKKNTDKTN